MTNATLNENSPMSLSSTEQTEGKINSVKPLVDYLIDEITSNIKNIKKMRKTIKRNPKLNHNRGVARR